MRKGLIVVFFLAAIFIFLFSINIGTAETIDVNWSCTGYLSDGSGSFSKEVNAKVGDSINLSFVGCINGAFFPSLYEGGSKLPYSDVNSNTIAYSAQFTSENEGTMTKQYTFVGSDIDRTYTATCTLTINWTFYTISASSDGNGSASATPEKGKSGDSIALSATQNDGYHFVEWEVTGGATIDNNQSASATLTMPAADVTVKAIFAQHQFELKSVDASAHQLTCTGCGVTSGDKEAHSFEYHSTADEKHSVSCSKGCGLEILESHAWTAKSDANYHWEECICKEIRGKAAHTPGDAVKEKEVAAKVGEAGSYDEVVYCTVCKAEISRKTVKTDPLPEPVKEYTVTYKNSDGTVLQSDKWKAGQIPLYTGMEPTEKENVYYRPFFIGWNPDVTAVTGDAEYTAVYKQDYKYYEVTFVRSEFSGYGKSYSYEKVRAGRPVNRPANPSDVERSESMHVTTTFSFSHWTLGENGNIGIPYDFSLPITHNITLSAVYKDDYERLYSMDDISKTKGIGCFIATCVYGSYDCPEVWVLRRFRDNVLAKSEPGRLFIELYYRWSPEIVEKYGDEPWFKPLVKPVLDKFVAYLKSIGFEDTPYEDPEYDSGPEVLQNP